MRITASLITFVCIIVFILTMIVLRISPITALRGVVTVVLTIIITPLRWLTWPFSASFKSPSTKDTTAELLEKIDRDARVKPEKKLEQSQSDVIKELLDGVDGVSEESSNKLLSYKDDGQRATFFSDQPAVADYLDFAPYAEILAGLIGAKNTKTPLTLGIFGSWGSGKTTLMRMIENELQKGQFVLIRFDAWKYYKEDSLWRALLLRVLDALRPDRDEGIGTGRKGANLDPSMKKLLKEIEHLEQGLYRDVEWEEKSGLTIDWPQLLKAGVGGALKLSFAFVPGLNTLTKA
jgi:hypothetical protein